jgi:dihydroorotase
MYPHHYCKPVAKKARDRDALVEAAISGCPKFFFGSDSAPHQRMHKECADCCAGIFTAPVALPLLAMIFERESALSRLEFFVRTSAATFYGLPEPSPMPPPVRLVPVSFQVAAEMHGFVPFYASHFLPWSVLT